MVHYIALQSISDIFVVTPLANLHFLLFSVELAVKMREKESPECGRMQTPNPDK